MKMFGSSILDFKLAFFTCQIFVTLCCGQQMDTFTSPDILHYAQILVEPSQSHLIIGARDTIIRLETNHLNITNDNIINWPANGDAIRACRMKGQSESLCRNYVKVLLGKNTTEVNSTLAEGDSVNIFVCGTNAFKPVCSWRKSDSLNTIESEEDASGKCPYNPSWNTTSLFTSRGIYFYFGPMDSQGHDNAVLRSKPSKSSTKWARTIAADTRFINHDASFITSFEKDDFVYFIFRESAIEYMNCGKTVYSRIGRLCIGDKGERRSSGRYLTTFVKTRLNCSLPGQFPFYFDEIQSAFYTNGTIYGVFSTPENSIHGSAICAFTISAVENAFQGPFKHQDTPGSMYKPEHNKDVASQFSCNSNSGKTDQIRNQAGYQLMDRSVGTSEGRPLLIEKARLTRIVVDSISTLHYSQVTVMFVLTNGSRLRRYVVWPGSLKACFISEWNLDLQTNDSVLSIAMVQSAHSIYLGTVKSLKKLSMSNCDDHLTRASCLTSGDPYCAWNKIENICTRFNLSSSPDIWDQNEDVICTERTKIVDWSPWSDWRFCSRIVNANETSQCQCRSRSCLTLACTEPDEVEVANCTVNGGWTAWSPWTQCTTSCGSDGTKTRSRSCTNPSPQYGGLPCVGASFEKIKCLDNPPCTTTTTSTTTPVSTYDADGEDNGWSSFSDWEECPVKCGGGVQVRRRTCSDMNPVGNRCRGCDMEWRLCNTEPCKEVRRTFETPWYRVNFTADGSGAIEERLKVTCKAFNLAEETDLALTPRREERTSPLSWSECSVKCGKGVQFMYTGSIYLKRACDTKVDCIGWSSWSKWSNCINGERVRFRSCKKEKCEGSEEERIPCSFSSGGPVLNKGLNSVGDDYSSEPIDNDLSSNQGKGMIEPGTIGDEEPAYRLSGFPSVSDSTSSLIEDPNGFVNNVNSRGWSTGNLILFACCAFIVGILFGTLITYSIMRRTLKDSDNSKLSLKLFTSQNTNDKTCNPYVTADHFRISNLNPSSSASTCLLNGVGRPSSLTSASSPMLNYSPTREATVKRASTIRAKLNSDQNF
ncbi:semaphorin-5A-like [Tetranychus urticae]|uniref:Sema domain-containing protein n=2 Tax=Tetranychus urticae TaxID=32264 RepID=T1JRR3_TETUR|nr:semaphorin-5A-like [Tetranychus urticae]